MALQWERSDATLATPATEILMRSQPSGIHRSALIVLLFSTVACATTGGMKSAPLSEGVAKTFSGNFDQILKASREAVVEAGLAIDEASKVDEKTWMIIGKKGASGWSWGELVRVVVHQTAPSQTSVTVFTQKRVSVNVTAKGDYSTAILSNVELKLK